MDVSFLEDPETFEYWYEKMKPFRKSKVDALKPESSKRLSLGAGILLDRALEELGIADYAIEIGDKGKPYLTNKDGGPAGTFFNLSHSGMKVALGISDREIGVDIERIRNFKDSLIERVFSDDEKELARNMAKANACKVNSGLDCAYTSLWTAKESVMKYSGQGLSLMPEAIELEAAGASPGKRAGFDAPGDGKPEKAAAKEACLSVRAEELDCRGLSLSIYAIEGYRLCVCSEYKEFEYYEE